MGDEENLSDLEMIEHLDASVTKSSDEGRQTIPTRLAQAIVADRELVAKIPATICANSAPNLNKSNPDSYGLVTNRNKTAVPEGQAEKHNTGVSLDQTGILENTAADKPVVSVDQVGAEKRASEQDLELDLPAKRPRTCLPQNLELTAQDDWNVDQGDDELLSPNSRWEASEELSDFLGTVSKRL